MLHTRYLLVLSVFFVFYVFTESAFAEAESFTIAARNYERKYIPLNEGDEIRYTVTVSGGLNDDVEVTIYYPNGSNDGGGSVYERFSDDFVAQSTGTYVFEFDNTSSILSNKSVKFSYQITKNTYYVYIDPLPEWADYASNVMYESTTYWQQVNPQLNFFKVEDPKDADLKINWVKDFGQEHIGYAYGSRFIEVGLGDSNCLETWNPYSSKHVASIMKHEIGHILGLEHSSDPNNIMYPSTQDTEYGIIELDFTLKENQIQFIPICTSKDVTTFDYNVSTSTENGFDVFFVPSIDEMNNWSENQYLRHYENDECFAEGYLEFGGTCNGIRKGSGLLIMASEPSTSDIHIQLLESSNPSSRESKTIIHEYDPPSIFEKVLESRTNEQSQSEKKDEITCSLGTIFENGKCVVDPDYPNPSTQGGCLIATATYGSEMAPQVQQLRETRDNIVMKTQSGATFMTAFNSVYYSFAPTVADWEIQNPIFKEVVKITITPLLSTLSILNYVNIDSEAEMLGYGIGVILLNIGMYLVAPAFVIFRLKQYKK